jgi:hypothetical protein
MKKFSVYVKLVVDILCKRSASGTNGHRFLGSMVSQRSNNSRGRSCWSNHSDVSNEENTNYGVPRSSVATIDSRLLKEIK